MSPLLEIALEGPCVNMRTAHELPAIVPGRGFGGDGKVVFFRCRIGSGGARLFPSLPPAVRPAEKKLVWSTPSSIREVDQCLPFF